jgi:hypothetical protein
MAKNPGWRVEKITFAYKTKRFDILGTVSTFEIASFWYSEYQA